MVDQIVKSLARVGRTLDPLLDVDGGGAGALSGVLLEDRQGDTRRAAIRQPTTAGGGWGPPVFLHRRGPVGGVGASEGLGGLTQ